MDVSLTSPALTGLSLALYVAPRRIVHLVLLQLFQESCSVPARAASQ